MSIGPFIDVVDIWGRAQQIDVSVGLAASNYLSDLPRSLRDLGFKGCTFTPLTGSALYIAQSQIEVYARIAAVGAQDEANGGAYVPTITSSGAGVIAVLGDFKFVQGGTRIHVTGRFTFNPAAPGTAETLSITLPVGDFALPTNFAAVTDACGVLASGAAVTATDSFDQPRAEVGAKRVQVIIDQSEASAQEYGITFAYDYE